MSGVARAARALAVAAGVTWGTRRLLEPRRRADPARWERTNHRGEPVALLEGPAVAAGLVAGSLATGGRVGAAGALATAGAAAFGLVDDLSEDTSRARKGLRGHLGALAHGELTTGGLKVLGIGAVSLVSAAVLGGRRVGAGALGRAADVAVSGALVAGTANLLNLLDLRPGRAAKAAVLGDAVALAGAGAPLAAAGLGAAAAALPGDLAERDMLGDAGANALGALLGVAAVAGAPRPVRVLLLGGVVGLTLASERVSFSAVIARTPVLRELDAWGRR